MAKAQRGDFGNKVSTHQRIMTSGDNEMIARYALKFGVYIAGALFMGFVGYSVFDPNLGLFDWGAAGNGWNDLKTAETGLIVTGCMTVGAATASYVVPKAVQMSKDYDASILEEIDRRARDKLKGRAQNLDKIEDTRDKQLDYLVREVTSYIKDNRSVTDTKDMISRAMDTYADEVCNYADKTIAYNDIYPKLKSLLTDGPTNARKPGLLEFFDTKRGLPARGDYLAVFDIEHFDDSTVKRNVFINTMKECGFDYDKAIGNPRAYPDFHEKFHSAVHKMSKRTAVEFNAKDNPECIPQGYVEGCDLVAFKLKGSSQTSEIRKYDQDTRKSTYEGASHDKIEKVRYDLQGYQTMLKDAMEHNISGEYLQSKNGPTTQLRTALRNLQSKEEGLDARGEVPTH